MQTGITSPTKNQMNNINDFWKIADFVKDDKAFKGRVDDLQKEQDLIDEKSKEFHKKVAQYKKLKTAVEKEGEAVEAKTKDLDSREKSLDKREATLKAGQDSFRPEKAALKKDLKDFQKEQDDFNTFKASKENKLLREGKSLKEAQDKAKALIKEYDDKLNTLSALVSRG